MNRLFFIFFLLASQTMLEGQSLPENKVPFLSFGEFEPLLHRQSDTTYVLNFWATWCGPCVRELPHFEKLGKEMAGRKVKIILVSLDFEEQIQSRLLPFLKRKKIKSEVKVLSTEGQQDWIDRVDPSWSGAIPATIIYRNNTKRVFYERAFNYSELKSTVLTFLEQQ